MTVDKTFIFRVLSVSAWTSAVLAHRYLFCANSR